MSKHDFFHENNIGHKCDSPTSPVIDVTKQFEKVLENAGKFVNGSKIKVMGIKDAVYVFDTGEIERLHNARKRDLEKRNDPSQRKATAASHVKDHLPVAKRGRHIRSIDKRSKSVTIHNRSKST